MKGQIIAPGEDRADAARHTAGMESDVWVDERVVVRPSGIEGRGWFAARDIAGGDVMVRLGGRLVTSAELDELLAAGADADGGYVDTVQVAEDVHLVLPPGTKAHYGNHSCAPNLGFDGPFAIRTLRAIPAGEELTVDYATCSGPGLVLDCGCGAAACRGRVVGRQTPPHG